MHASPLTRIELAIVAMLLVCIATLASAITYRLTCAEQQTHRCELSWRD